MIRLFIIVVCSTPGAGDGGSPAFSRPAPPSFLPTDPATPTLTKPASTPAPVDAPTGVPSTGGSSSTTDVRSVKDPSAQSSAQARYCEQVQSYLQGRRAFSRSAAVTLQSLGVAVPRPQALSKIRPALEESPLFHLEQVREGGRGHHVTEADTRFGLLAHSSLLWWWCAACMHE